MPPPTPLAVATSSINRLLKEETSYEKELVAQQKRLADLKGISLGIIEEDPGPLQPHQHDPDCFFHEGKPGGGAEEGSVGVEGATTAGDVVEGTTTGDVGGAEGAEVGGGGLKGDETATVGEGALKGGDGEGGGDDAINVEEDVENKEFRLKQEEQAIEETKKVFGPLREKIEGAVEKVEAILNSGATNDQKEIEAAGDAVRSARGEEGFVFAPAV